MHESEASSLGEKMGLMDRTDVSINSRMGDYGACVCHEEVSERTRLFLPFGGRSCS